MLMLTPIMTGVRRGIKESISHAIKAVCPVKRRNHHPWISRSTVQLVDERKSTHNRIRRNFLGREIKRRLKADREAWWCERADDMQRASDRGDSRSLFQTVNLIAGAKRPSPPITLNDRNGNALRSVQERTDRWREYYEDLYNRPDPSNLDQDLLDEAFPAESEMVDQSAPTLEEISKVVSSLKTRKSVGTCDIPAEALRALDSDNLVRIRDLIGLVWRNRSVPQDFKDGIIVPVYKKGAKSDCSNYRGITLLSIAGKILTTIIRSRMLRLYESTIRDQQAGFRGGRGCADQIFLLRRCIERRLRHGQPAVVCFIDFAAAFDSIHRDSMWAILRKCNLPSLFVDILRDMYSGASSWVRTGSGNSNTFSIRTGVRQGCVLSPVLFNLVLDWALKKAVTAGDGVMCSDLDVVCDLEYADDIAILQPDEASCQSLLDRIAESAGRLGLTIKPAKTKAMSFHLPSPPVLWVGGTQIEVVSTFTYLGSVISSEKVSAAEDITVRIAKASATFGRLKVHLFRRQDIAPNVKMKIYNAAILSILLYGSESWSLTQSEIRQLETFQMYCLRTILGVSIRERIPNAHIRQQCQNQPSVESLIRKNRLRWLGHVARMPPDRLCHSVWRNPKPRAWRCVRNAAKKTWDSLIAADLKFLKDAYGSANWSNNYIDIIADLAQDRTQWRQLCGGRPQLADR
jgi:hypothetical protein